MMRVDTWNVPMSAGRAGTVRFSVCFAPHPEHPLWRAGCDWLGRDARQGMPNTPPARLNVAAAWRDGFRATLEAPMALRPDVTEAGFLGAVRVLASNHEPFVLPPLRVALLDGYVVLRLREEPSRDHPLRQLADDSVYRLEPWRADLSDSERLHRTRPHHGPRQRAQVDRFGCAQVLDDWRFHITLSGPQDEGSPLRQEASLHFGPALECPLMFDALCVFVDNGRGGPYAIAHRFWLGR